MLPQFHGIKIAGLNTHPGFYPPTGTLRQEHFGPSFHLFSPRHTLNQGFIDGFNLAQFIDRQQSFE